LSEIGFSNIASLVGSFHIRLPRRFQEHLPVSKMPEKGIRGIDQITEGFAHGPKWRRGAI